MFSRKMPSFYRQKKPEITEENQNQCCGCDVFYKLYRPIGNVSTDDGIGRGARDEIKSKKTNALVAKPNRTRGPRRRPSKGRFDSGRRTGENIEDVM